MTLSYNSSTKNSFLKALNEKANVLGEVEVREFKSFFNHQFSHIPQNEDISKLYFTTNQTTNTTIDRHGAEYRLHLDASTNESISIETNEHGHYSPGSIALPGIGMRVGSDLSGEQEVRGGYFCDTDGIGIGEDSDGLFVFKRDGGNEQKVRQENWNMDTLLGTGDPDNPSELNLSDLQDGHIIRFPFLCYNYGEFNVVIGVKDKNKDLNIIDIHKFTETGDELLERINLPIKIEVENNNTATELDAYLTAVHFERLNQEVDSRQNGVVRLNQSVGETWTPLISYRLRSGWNGVNVLPQKIKVNSDTTLELDIQLNPVLSTTDFSLPTHTSSNECAIEVDTSATGFDSFGERRWSSFVSAGGAVKSNSVDSDLNFNLPIGQVVTLAAISQSGTATVDSGVGWSSEF